MKFEPVKTDNGTWRILHKPSGLFVTPSLSHFARKMTKPQAKQLANAIEKIAPFDIPEQVSGVLLESSIMANFRLWINPTKKIDFSDVIA